MPSAYGITPDDLLGRFTADELKTVSADAPRPAERDDSVILGKIDEGEGAFHARAATFYIIPLVIAEGAAEVDFDATMVDVKSNLLDIIAYKLMQRRPQLLNVGDRAAYWSAIRKSTGAWLKGLASPNDDDRVLLIAAKLRSDVTPASGGAWSESEPRRTSTRALRSW